MRKNRFWLVICAGVAAAASASVFAADSKSCYGTRSAVAKQDLETYPALEDETPSSASASMSFETESSLKHANLRTAPLGLLLGLYGFDLDIGLGERFTLGPTFTHFGGLSTVLLNTVAGLNFNLSMIGVRSNLYLSSRRFESGWIFAPEATYIPYSARLLSNGKAFSASSHAWSAGANIGYQWNWRSGFNLMLGAGARVFTTSKTLQLVSADQQVHSEDTPSFTGVLPSLDFSLGYAF